jgi:hypothetical protein
MNCLPLDLQRIINCYLPDKEQYNEVLKELDELYTDSIYYDAPMIYILKLQSENGIYIRDLDILIDRFEHNPYEDTHGEYCDCSICYWEYTMFKYL